MSLERKSGRARGSTACMRWPPEVELSADKWGLEGLSENVGAPSGHRHRHRRLNRSHAAMLTDLARILSFGDRMVEMI